jgi:hypothetical protein
VLKYRNLSPNTGKYRNLSPNKENVGSDEKKRGKERKK